jgi:uncharacterized protein YndB with AHSA1/START domain
LSIEGSVMESVQNGCLVLADISGYTEYLGGVELEHCHDVLANLLGVVAGQMGGALRVAKFEGDAVFGYDPRNRVDADVLVATIDACYFEFARLRREIEANRACACDACRRVPELDLKLVAHHGAFVEERIGGSRELFGSDVVLAHRLLKSAVSERTGLRGYALLTAGGVERLGIDAAGLGLAEHTETYEGVGEVVCWVRDLDVRWREEQERTAVVVTPEESFATIEGDVPVPPAIVWEYLTSPEKKALWRTADKRIETHGPRRTRGVGQVTHCMMKPPYGVYVETCLDWKPYRYHTFSQRGRFGEFIYTTELTPLADGASTHFTSRFRLVGRRARVVARLVGRRRQTRLWQQGADKLTALLKDLATGEENTAQSSAPRSIK